MGFEFDHLFICTELGAAAADRLVAFGLTEGSSNVHPGQGTANRRFFFRNAMLELLWIANPSEAQSVSIRPTRLWERWLNRSQGACPVGICLRPAAGGSSVAAFHSWAYRPPYLPANLSIAVGSNSDILAEPMLFQTPFGKRPDQLPPERAQPLEHRAGLQEITRVTLVGPVAQPPTPELQAVLDTHQLQLRADSTYCVELGFDGEQQGQKADFRPHLPLVLSW
jgi:Glyoxalase-like domain